MLQLSVSVVHENTPGARGYCARSSHIVCDKHPKVRPTYLSTEQFLVHPIAHDGYSVSVLKLALEYLR